MAWKTVPRGWNQQREEIIAKHLTSAEINTLAIYNSERWRGIAHTVEWRDRMADIQDRYDRAMAEVTTTFDQAVE